MAVEALSILARCIALGCAVNFEFVIFGGSGPLANIAAVMSAATSGEIAIVGSPSYGFWPSTGIILLFIALALQIVAFAVFYITLRYAKLLSDRVDVATRPKAVVV